jgi:hypothetical protein
LIKFEEAIFMQRGWMRPVEQKNDNTPAFQKIAASRKILLRII